MKKMIINLIAAFVLVAGMTAASADFDPEDLGATPAKVWVTPLELDFGPLGLGQTATQTVAITNLGGSTLTNFAGGGVNAPFSALQDCAGGVAPGATCHYYFQFTPTAAGDFSTTSSSTTNGGAIRVAVKGRGVGGALTASPLSLDFGSVSTGVTVTQTVTVKNTGQAVLEGFAGGGVSSPFSANQNCADGVDPGETCVFNYMFTPTAAGTFYATSTVSSDGGNFQVVMKGRGRTSIMMGGLKATPLIFDFGPVGVGDFSPYQTLTLTNQSLFNDITGIYNDGVTGPFLPSTDCPATLTALSSCHYYYWFAPTAAGLATSAITIHTSSGDVLGELRGMGVGPSLTFSPTVLDFGPAALNTTSTQTVTIRNTGMSTLEDFAGGGVFPPFFASQNCAGGVPPGGSCQYFFRFTPTKAGWFSAISNTSTNGGSMMIQLYGGERIPLFLPLVIAP